MVWFVSTWGVTSSGKLIAGVIDVIALGFAVPFVWIGTSRIADPSQTVQAANYSSSSVSIGGHSHIVSRATGSSTVKFSRRGAIGFTCFGLVFYLGLMIGGVFAARAPF